MPSDASVLFAGVDRAALGVTDLERHDVIRTLGAVVKTPDDRDLVVAALDELGIEEATA